MAATKVHTLTDLWDTCDENITVHELNLLDGPYKVLIFYVDEKCKMAAIARKV